MVTPQPSNANWAGIGPVAPRPGEDLAPLIAWLRTGKPAETRLDFPAGTALPDGRLDLCKQAVGPAGAARVAAALPGTVHSGATQSGTAQSGATHSGTAQSAQIAVRHLLLGTDGLGDGGAAAVAAAADEKGIDTLYLGCNGITAGGVCRMADNLRESAHASRVAGLGSGVKAVWLKRNPLGPEGGEAAAALVESAPGLRTLDLVQTGLTAAALTALAEALIAAHGTGREFERLYVGGNPLGEPGARALAGLIAAGAVGELYISAAGLGDAGARVLADALAAAPPDKLHRLSVASNGIGPAASARLAASAARAGVAVLDFGRVRAARVLGAEDNRVDTGAADAIGSALAAAPHRMTHLILSDTGMRSPEAISLLRHLEAPRSSPPIRVVIGKGVATTVRRRFSALARGVPQSAIPPDVAAVQSVHRTAPQQ